MQSHKKPKITIVQRVKTFMSYFLWRCYYLYIASFWFPRFGALTRLATKPFIYYRKQKMAV